MRKNVAWPLVAVIAVLLIGVNLYLREDPEPDLGDVEPVARPHDTGVVDVPSPEDLDDQMAPDPDGEEGPEGALTEEPDEGADASCDHPLIPAGRGQWRRYRWSQSDQDREAVLRVRAGAAREVEDEVHVAWRVRVIAADDDSELAEETMITRCVPGETAEEPWFGILERSLGLRLTARSGRWRWPAQLEADQRFEGIATFDPRNAEMRPPEGAAGPAMLRVRRAHRVIRRESVEVPAGRFDAWRVEFEETQQFGEHGETGNGVQWVAPEVGLVKLEAENSQGVSQTIVLERLGPS